MALLLDAAEFVNSEFHPSQEGGGVTVRGLQSPFETRGVVPDSSRLFRLNKGFLTSAQISEHVGVRMFEGGGFVCRALLWPSEPRAQAERNQLRRHPISQLPTAVQLRSTQRTVKRRLRRLMLGDGERKTWSGARARKRETSEWRLMGSLGTREPQRPDPGVELGRYYLSGCRGAVRLLGPSPNQQQHQHSYHSPKSLETSSDFSSWVSAQHVSDITPNIARTRRWSRRRRDASGEAALRAAAACEAGHARQLLPSWKPRAFLENERSG
ncbi:unnamed protein product [Lampetra planeri]